MTSRADGVRGILLYSVTTLAGATLVAALLHALGISVGENRAAPFVLGTMWMPALGRFVATRTVDRGWRPPFPARRWGTPGIAIVLVPLGIVSAIYLGAYAIVALAGVPRAAPAWEGRIAANIAVNLPILAVAGAVGSFGEEIGWRGYLQPRLDQLEVPASLLWVIVVETIFHLPLILFAGYTGDSSAASIALFFGLGLGLTPVWTWATYRWRSIWIAVAFHTFHNAVSQTIAPKALGEPGPFLLGESGILPVALYMLAAAVIFGTLRARGLRWRDLARSALITAPSGGKI